MILDSTGVEAASRKSSGGAFSAARADPRFRHHRRTLIWIQLGPFFFAPLPCEKVLIPWAFFGFSHTICCLDGFFLHAHPASFLSFTVKSPSRPTLKSCARWGNSCTRWSNRVRDMSNRVRDRGNRVRDGVIVCEMG